VLFPDRFTRQSTRPVLFVPNLHDAAGTDSPFPTVSPLRGWNRVVEEIVSSDFVIASSLHGLIVAEAYGIPARYIRLSETESLFKYEDYALGSGRPGFDYATSFDEAVEMGGMAPISFDTQALLSAFPYDLWR
jgi:pyruvyltransferase